MAAGGARQPEDGTPVVGRNASRSRLSIGGMTALGIGLLVITIVVAVANGGPTGRSYAIGGLALALLIGGRIIDAIRAR